MTTRFRVASGHGQPARKQDGKNLSVIAEAPGVAVYGDGSHREWNNADGSRALLFGEITGVRSSDGAIQAASVSSVSPSEFASVKSSRAVEGRYVLVRIAADGTCDISRDRFGAVDVYYRNGSAAVTLASGLDLLGVSNSAPDPVGYAHALVAYGYRPAKRHTLFAEIKRMGVDESLRVVSGSVDLVARPFNPLPVGAYAEQDLGRYADTLIEAVRARGSADGNVVYLSSGWDSTSLLACLVHIFGARKVRAVIGRMQYANRSGVINQFELDRAKAVAEFFGVPLEVCEFDYRTGAPELLDRVRPLFQSQQLASVTGLNHFLLASHTAATSAGGEAVFAGEMSDGAHNLGFSQFVTIFHPVLDFREYADKMGSYLYGPTFFEQFRKGKFEDDLVWQIFRTRAGEAAFDDLGRDAAERTRQMLASFFLRGNRLPLWSLRNSRVLTDQGRDVYTREMQATYLDRASNEVTPETLYSWYLHLYNSFHWQGSTVATLAHTAAANGLRAELPFHDGALQDFLSAMPESWGRGLDLKPTKYPLKWMLQNRVRYPMHLQVGPHSYLYDVDPSFSHSAELLYGSSFAPLFRAKLKSRAYEAWLDPSIFDMAYIDRIAKRYVAAGEEVRGGEMNDLMTLCTLAMVGRQGDA
jgi:Asparagine synthase